MIKIPIKPIISAVVLWKRITSPSKITANIVVKRGVVKPNAVAFSKCIVPKAVNQQIIEIIFIKALINWNLKFFDFSAAKLFLTIKGESKINPAIHLKKHIIIGLRSSDKYLTLKEISAAKKDAAIAKKAT